MTIRFLFDVLLNTPLEETLTFGTRFDYPLNSHIGEHCRHIITKAKELMSLCDEHAHPYIRKAAFIACEVIIYG